MSVQPVHLTSVPGFDGASKVVTAKGPVPVRSLRPGDLVLTRDHGFQLVRWVMTPASFEQINSTLVGASQYHSQFLLSQMSLSRDSNGEECLTLAKLFPNEHDALRADAPYQILFDQHQLIMLDGVWTASFMFDDAIWRALPKEDRARIILACPNLNASVNQTGGPKMKPARPLAKHLRNSIISSITETDELTQAFSLA